MTVFTDCLLLDDDDDDGNNNSNHVSNTSKHTTIERAAPMYLFISFTHSPSLFHFRDAVHFDVCAMTFSYENELKMYMNCALFATWRQRL